MTKKEKNEHIVKLTRDIIAQMGLSEQLDIFPVENTFTYRQQYWNDGKINRFKVHMWDLNNLELDSEELYNEILDRINQAVKHFEL